MENQYVSVILQTKNQVLNEVLPFGYKTMLKPKYSTEEKLVVSAVTKKNKNGLTEVVSPAVYSPVGTFEGYTFKGVNGLTYADSFITDCVGLKSLSEVFKKI